MLSILSFSINIPFKWVFIDNYWYVAIGDKVGQHWPRASIIEGLSFRKRDYNKLWQPSKLKLNSAIISFASSVPHPNPSQP
jgi:hypothetical protein